MERLKRILGHAVIPATMLALCLGTYLYRQHQLQQRAQRTMERQQKLQSMPKGGVVVDDDGTIRWQDSIPQK
jgi:hypothetical protein